MQIQRHPASPRILAIRPMTEADIELLRQPSKRPDIVRLRDAHHTIARLLASGLKTGEVARAVGYSETRIAVIRSAPAMQDLIARYRAEETESWRAKRDEFYESIHAAGAKAWRQINEALDDADETGERLPVRNLLSIADSSADRIGYNKKSTTVNINVDFAAKLEAAIARSKPVIIENQLED